MFKGHGNEIVLKEFYVTAFYEENCQRTKEEFYSNLEHDCLTVAGMQRQYGLHPKEVIKELRVIKKYLNNQNSDSPFLNYNKGVINLIFQQYTESYTQMRRKAYPQFSNIDDIRGKSRAMNFTGFIFLNLGDFCTARLFFARAIEADKTNIQPYLNLAMGHAMCGHTDEAIIYMQKSYIYAPSDEKIVESGKSIDNILKQVLKSNSEESDSIKVPKATFKEKWMKHKHSQLVELLFEDEEPVSTHIYDGSRHGINFVFLPLTGHVKKSSNGRYGRARRIKDLEHIETTLIMSSMLIQDISEKEKGLDALRQIGFVSSDPTNQKHSEKR